MPKKKSSLMAYFLNIGTVGAPNFASLGKGISSLPIAYNPQVTTETYITEDNATSSVDSYQVSAGIDVALWDSVSAPAHAYMETIRRTRAVGPNCESQILEIDISGASPYPATLNNAVIALDTFTIEGGKPQQLSQTIHYNGDPVQGTATITNGVVAFTPTAIAAVALSTIVPADAATAIAVSANVVLTFNNKIRGENVFLMTAAGVLVPVVKSWDGSGTILTLDPVSNMGAATVHLVGVAGVTDIYGQVLASAVKKFTTA